MTIELGVLISVLGLIIAFQGYQLNKQKQQSEQKKTIKEETKQQANQDLLSAEKDVRLQTQLEYISKGVDDIRIDLRASEKERIALGERVTRVEESTKQAHKRIDSIEKKEDN